MVTIDKLLFLKENIHYHNFCETSLSFVFTYLFFRDDVEFVADIHFPKDKSNIRTKIHWLCENREDGTIWIKDMNEMPLWFIEIYNKASMKYYHLTRIRKMMEGAI